MREVDKMQVKILPFGVVKGQTYDKIEMTNERGVTIATTNLGAGLVSWQVPNKINKSQKENILLGFSQAKDMMADRHYLSGRSQLNAKIQSDYNNCLENNSGVDEPIRSNLKFQQITIPFQNLKWDYNIIDSKGALSIKFMLENPDEKIIRIQVTYQFTEDNRLIIHDQVELKNKGLVQFKRPLYFNLNGNIQETVKNHELISSAIAYRLNAGDKWHPIIDSSSFDLSKGAVLQEQFVKKEHDFELKQGYDHDFVLEMNDLDKSSQMIRIRANHRSMTIYANTNGFHLNSYNVVWRPRRLFAHLVKPHSGLAVIPQRMNYPVNTQKEKEMLQYLYDVETTYYYEEEQ